MGLSCLLIAAALSGCSGSGSSQSSASGVVSSLGAVPIPTAPRSESTESAAPGKPAVLAIGGPVAVRLGSTRLLATALGPEQVVSAPPSGPSAEHSALPTSTQATITLRIVPSAGSVRVLTKDLSSRDETGRLITLTPVGPDSAIASPDHPVTLKVMGTFDSGAAQVTWSEEGHPLAIWTFNIELD